VPNPPPTVARPWLRRAVPLITIGVIVASWALIFYGDSIGIALGIRGAVVSGPARILLVAGLQVVAGFLIGRWWALLLALTPAVFLLMRDTPDGMHGIDFAPFIVPPVVGLTGLGVMVRQSTKRPSDAGASNTVPRSEQP
jgi:hypothetical protein